MSKDKISDYSATANSNTDIGGINIDEGCAPSGINDAIRTLMKQLKDFQQGTNSDPFNGPHNGTVGATTPASGAFTTLSASSTLSVTGAGTIQGLTVGKGAGAVSTNTAVGASALAANTTGSSNTAIGNSAGYSNQDGTSLTAVGLEAGYSNTSGSNNVFMGRQAGKYTTTASDNTGIGTAALTANTTGASNTAVGRQALQANTTASNNTAVGYQAGYTNATGTATTFMGYKAGYASTGTGNTFIGSNAGVASTGTYNTFVGGGNGSGINMTTGSKNVILGDYSGNNGGLDIRTASNYIVLSDGDGNPRMWANSAAWVIPTGGRLTLNTGAGGAGLGGGVDIRQSSSTGRIDFYNDGGSTLGVQYFYYNGVEKGSITVSSTATAYVTSSDYRLKNSVAPMTGALAKVAALKPCTYKWNADGSDGEGFIAHELAEVCPQAVTGEKDAVDENGNPVYQGIDTSFLVATLTAAIQELNAKFEAYKAAHP